jgi:hypothetical protein
MRVVAPVPVNTNRHCAPRKRGLGKEGKLIVLAEKLEALTLKKRELVTSDFAERAHRCR